MNLFIASVRKSGSPEVRKSFFAEVVIPEPRLVVSGTLCRIPIQKQKVILPKRTSGLPDFRTSGLSPRTSGLSRNGFTILELLLVLVILSVLAAIVASRFAGQSNSAKIKAAQTQLSNFNLALNRFEIDLGRYPSSSEGLRVLIEKPSDGGKTWQGPYLDGDQVPLDQWSNAWNYRQPGQHREDGFDLWSNGPDGREGSEDDVTNWTK
jgi:general secretion pathway protein G